mmetsp:Transcript_120035/g.340291  ORF Transcript_120035/g.340291 Transcript_120035/m.340291 type:complete len:213 (-) Transcript_120035:1668-2306(-)
MNGVEPVLSRCVGSACDSSSMMITSRLMFSDPHTTDKAARPMWSPPLTNVPNFRSSRSPCSSCRYFSRCAHSCPLLMRNFVTSVAPCSKDTSSSVRPWQSRAWSTASAASPSSCSLSLRDSTSSDAAAAKSLSATPSGSCLVDFRPGKKHLAAVGAAAGRGSCTAGARASWAARAAWTAMRCCSSATASSCSSCAIAAFCALSRSSAAASCR